MPARPPRPAPIPLSVSVALVIALALAATGCGSSDSSAKGGTTGTSGAPATSTTAGAASTASHALAEHPCGRTGTPPKTYDHVVILMEENRTWEGGRSRRVGLDFSDGQMPFLHGLATQCTSYATWVEADTKQFSLSQYVGLTSGVQNPNTVNDCAPSATCRSTDDNLFRQIREAKGTPRTFVDGASEGCSVGTNAAKHIPALYYQGGNDPSFCKQEVRPLHELDPDHLPTLSFIVPDLCNDGHDCADSIVESFAKATLTPILQGASYGAGKTLVVVIYDEDQNVPNLLIAPTAHHGLIRNVAGSHADLLKTIELALGLPIMQQGDLPTASSLRPSAHL